MKYESNVLKRLVDTYGVIGNPKYMSEIIKQFIVQGKECFPHLFTYQADWLAHIDEFGLTSDYVVSYTGQQIYAPHSKEKPVKRAILKGNTLVNLHKLENYSNFGVLLDEGWKQHFGKNDSYATWRMFDISMLKPNTDYGVFCWVSENTLSETYWECHVHHSSDTVFNAISGLRFNAGETGMRFGKLTTISDFTGKTCGLRHLININTPSTEYVKFRCVLMEYQEGMENWDIPYFTGMQSVKMPVLTTTGKNLFDFQNAQWLKGGNFNPTYGNSGNIVIENMSLKLSNPSSCVGTIVNGLKPNTEYYVTAKVTNTSPMFINSELSYGVNNTTINGGINRKLTTNSKGELAISIGVYKENTNGGYVLIENIQVEEGSVATSYEPYKTNILSCNEEVELRGIGGVKDTLDCLTGEVTERIGEIVLDGSENWSLNGFVSDANIKDNMCYFSFKDDNLNCIINQRNGGLSDSLKNIDCASNSDKEGWQIFNNQFRLSLLKEKLSENTINGIKLYLQQNPITIQYQLATNPIKTVDLTIKDQNNVVVNCLATFKGGTHFYTTSQVGSLKPMIEVDVVTDLAETLNLCSLDGNTM